MSWQALNTRRLVLSAFTAATQFAVRRARFKLLSQTHEKQWRPVMMRWRRRRQHFSGQPESRAVAPALVHWCTTIQLQLNASHRDSNGGAIAVQDRSTSVSRQSRKLDINRARAITISNHFSYARFQSSQPSQVGSASVLSIARRPATGQSISTTQSSRSTPWPVARVPKGSQQSMEYSHVFENQRVLIRQARRWLVWQNQLGQPYRIRESSSVWSARSQRNRVLPPEQAPWRSTSSHSLVMNRPVHARQRYVGADPDLDNGPTLSLARIQSRQVRKNKPPQFDRPAELVWRRPQIQQAITAVGSPEAAALIPSTPIVGSTTEVTRSKPVALEQTAVLATTKIDPALLDRLTDDVIRRVDQRMRIERQRRGL